MRDAVRRAAHQDAPALAERLVEISGAKLRTVPLAIGLGGK